MFGHDMYQDGQEENYSQDYGSQKVRTESNDKNSIKYENEFEDEKVLPKSQRSLVDNSKDTINKIDQQSNSKRSDKKQHYIDDRNKDDNRYDEEFERNSQNFGGNEEVEIENNENYDKVDTPHSSRQNSNLRRNLIENINSDSHASFNSCKDSAASINKTKNSNFESPKHLVLNPKNAFCDKLNKSKSISYKGDESQNEEQINPVNLSKASNKDIEEIDNNLNNRSHRSNNNSQFENYDIDAVKEKLNRSLRSSRMVYSAMGADSSGNSSMIISPNSFESPRLHDLHMLILK